MCKSTNEASERKKRTTEKKRKKHIINKPFCTTIERTTVAKSDINRENTHKTNAAAVIRRSFNRFGCVVAAFVAAVVAVVVVVVAVAVAVHKYNVCVLI